MTFDSPDEIRNRFPLHYFVWKDDCDELRRYLRKNPNSNVELLDPRGRSPLMLAVTLNHKKCAKVLMNNNALVNVTDSSGFNVLHEAVTSLDEEFVYNISEQKRLQSSSMIKQIPHMLEKLSETQDFYVEMKWDFSSWLPMVSSFLPSDTYKIYKSGSKLRIDFTLAGINSSGIGGTPKYIRGNRTYIITFDINDANLYIIDHGRKIISQEQLMTKHSEETYHPSVYAAKKEVRKRISKPIQTAFLATDKIQFERAKKGLIFSSNKSEVIEGFNCDVYNSFNVQLVHLLRAEHLPDKQSTIAKSTGRSHFATLLGLEEKLSENPFKDDSEASKSRNPYEMSMLDYFNVTDPDKDIGIPRDMVSKTYKISPSIWMSEEFPLSLPEQIQPILNLLSMTSSHYNKLRDLVQTKLPPGFPVKIDVPLFHFLTAHITFQNVFARDKPVDGVQNSSDNLDKPKCVIDPSLFDVDYDYKKVELDFSDIDLLLEDDEEEEDEEIQTVIEKSLKEFQNSSEMEDLQKRLQNPQACSRENDDEFEDALESLEDTTNNTSQIKNIDDEQLLRALKQSKVQLAEDARLRDQEEKDVQIALKKSLSEK